MQTVRFRSQGKPMLSAWAAREKLASLTLYETVIFLSGEYPAAFPLPVFRRRALNE
jgi:hypothetical protein